MSAETALSIEGCTMPSCCETGVCTLSYLLQQRSHEYFEEGAWKLCCTVLTDRVEDTNCPNSEIIGQEISQITEKKIYDRSVYKLPVKNY